MSETNPVVVTAQKREIDPTIATAQKREEKKSS
jgi:hypothetical protein